MSKRNGTISSSSEGGSSRMDSTMGMLLSSLYGVLILQVFYMICKEAYNIRMYAINEYGRVIHEFDPYFNYRATEYLWANGWDAFSHWFDRLVWYPLGRPVGTTIFPGMQVTSCLIKQYIIPDWSINDICCFVPTWFGVLATISTSLLTFECMGQGQMHPKQLSQIVFANNNNKNTTTTTTTTTKGKKKQTAVDDTPPSPHQYYNPYECSLKRIPFVYDKIIAPLVVGMFDLMDTYLGTTLGLRPHTIYTPGIECAVFAGAIMSIVPAHILRSIGGGYDNESVATTAMVFTFYCWTRTLRNQKQEWLFARRNTAKSTTGGGTVLVKNPFYNSDSTLPFSTMLWGVVTGFAYFNMVAAWGGYVFVLNTIGVHASLLVMMGRFTTKLYYSYTCFYLVGTYLATKVPVVGLAPLKSLEQIGPMLTFIIFQLMQIAEYWVYQKMRQLNATNSNKNKKKTTTTKPTKKSKNNTTEEEDTTNLSTTNNDGTNATITTGTLYNVYYYRWKYRIILGNIVFSFLFLLCWLILAPSGYFGPISSRVRGLFVKHTKTGNPLVDSVAEHQAASTDAYYQYLNKVMYLAPIGYLIVCLQYFNDSSSFLLVWGSATYFFSHKMVRLILLTAPIGSVLGGIALGYIWSWMVGAIFTTTPSFQGLFHTYILATEETPTTNDAGKQFKKEDDKGDPIVVRLLRLGISMYLIYTTKDDFKEFHRLAHEMAKGMSHPTIIVKARTHAGEDVLIDDYREAYFWLRDNTPEDARIMAWWDYGYQITGIANRTTIADGNTWNHEHIALLGRTLTAPEKEGHRIARHLADYILIWAGGGGDDVAKSPHLMRIANSVYRGLCSEPTCRQFGFYSDGTPTPQMANSMLYKLHSHGLKQGVEADKNRFKIVMHSKYGKVRIYKILKVSKESKEWVEDPKNRICDGWICRGQYPPALKKVLAQKKDFQQLEDFNVKKGDDSEYQREYMENLMNNDPNKRQKKKRQKRDKLSLTEIDAMNQKREDNQYTTLLWQLISQGNTKELTTVLTDNPQLAHIRSADGRGPMWWAYEYKRNDVIAILKSHMVSDERTDDSGLRPKDL